MHHPEKARPLLEQAVPKYKAKVGPNDRDTLFGMYFLARVYAEAGEFAKAVPLLEEALHSNAKWLPDDSALLIAMAELAAWHLEIQQADRAVALFAKQLDMERHRPAADGVSYIAALGSAVQAWATAIVSATPRSCSVIASPP